jgi:hypothetical protein
MIDNFLSFSKAPSRGFFAAHAFEEITFTPIENISDFENDLSSKNEIKLPD